MSRILSAVLDEFRPRFAADALLVTAPLLHQPNRFRPSARNELNVRPLPNCIFAQPKLDRLILVDVYDLRGQLTAPRCKALIELFAWTALDLVILNAFATRNQVDWLQGLPSHTAAWFADEPAHLVHFDEGPLFGPYPPS
jgi:hypothetical protein